MNTFKLLCWTLYQMVNGREFVIPKRYQLLLSNVKLPNWIGLRNGLEHFFDTALCGLFDLKIPTPQGVWNMMKHISHFSRINQAIWESCKCLYDMSKPNTPTNKKKKSRRDERTERKQSIAWVLLWKRKWAYQSSFRRFDILKPDKNIATTHRKEIKKHWNDELQLQFGIGWHPMESQTREK